MLHTLIQTTHSHAPVHTFVHTLIQATRSHVHPFVHTLIQTTRSHAPVHTFVQSYSYRIHICLVNRALHVNSHLRVGLLNHTNLVAV